MWFLARSQAALYREYRAALRERGMPESVRTAARVVLVLNLAFVPLDAYAFPEKFQDFLIARLLLCGALAIAFWARHRHPVAAQSALCLATGGLLLYVIYGSGAPMGEYYVGLVLALVGLPVLMPLDPTRAAAMWSLLVGGYLVSPLVAGGAFEARTFVIHSLFLVSGGFTGVACSVYLTRVSLRDYAQRREIEAAHEDLKETDRIKSRFTANVHHELRTPLTLTLAPLEAILAGEFGEVPEALRSYLKTMHVNALRLLKLINNLLDLAKVEGRQLSLHRRELDVAKIVTDIVAGARPLADRKGIALATEVAGDLPVVYADEDAFEKIVVNLLGNALKFTDAGGRITARLARDPEGIRLSVEDTGIGLPADQLERIFDRFAQVDSSATRRHEGTGIGLSLVKELVGLHGGRVYAESPGLGQGTRMHVVLPIGSADAEAADALVEEDAGRTDARHRSLDGMSAELDLASDGSPAQQLVELERSVARFEEAGAAPAPASQAAAGPGPHAAKIVIAEDNPDMRRLLVDLIGREYQVRATRNGREALEAVAHEPPDLVLTDVMMPEMSGTELCAAIKRDPKTRGIPVILVTSKADRQMKIEGLELGADDYVTKPFHPRELLARVRGLVALRGLQAELSVRNARLEAALAELRAAEVQLVQSERLAAVGQLAAGIAHEVNNPVNFALNAARALKGATDDVRRVIDALEAVDWSDRAHAGKHAEKLAQLRRELDFEEVADQVAELARIVTDGLERTSRLVGNLSDFAGAGRTSTTPVDVRQGLRSTANLIGPTLRGAGIALTLDLADGLPLVFGDAGALNQVFLNLLKNAADACDGGGHTIAVRARAEGANVVVEVEDDGAGIAPEIRKRLFEPFVTTRAAGRGTGLGLSISQRVVKAHHGSIALEDAPERGTIARVTLPAAV
jgi:signal transduction histidine kinase